MNDLKKIAIDDFKINPFTSLAKDWMLISAGDATNYNTLTASWGGFGFLWNENVSYIFIRPQRYTKEFIDNYDTYSLCFFDDEYKDKLSYLGSVSGRDENKIDKVDMEVALIDETPYFKDAKTVIICRKLYQQTLTKQCFLEKDKDVINYPENDYHTMYIARIISIYQK